MGSILDFVNGRVRGRQKGGSVPPSAITFDETGFDRQGEHAGVTGMRDTAVLTNLINSGETELDTETGSIVGWLDDPYEPDQAGPMTRNKSERPEYDWRFPDHPLSRARWVLDHLGRTVKVDDEVKRQPGFVWQP
jgi:hypothetical protein